MSELPKTSPALPTLISGGHYPSLPVDFKIAQAMRRQAQLLGYLHDLRQLTFFELLWNTGARPNEALALCPEHVHLEDDQGCCSSGRSWCYAPSSNGCAAVGARKPVSRSTGCCP
ncbi:MAG: hypothetical protein EKE20_16450 [Candidatus Symbiopectobacterium sp. Dall1.0]|nr:hypothetical protein [Candidatus Symbiopectobacterium sp. Dall1.0]